MKKKKKTKLESRVEELETICQNMTNTILELQDTLDNTHNLANNKNQQAKEDITSTTEILKQHINEIENKMEDLKNNQNEVRNIQDTLNDIRPKLVRLKSRKEFKNEQSYIDYICKTLDTWDSKIYGKILVRVCSNIALGKGKHFINCVGEPIKWNQNVCKVQWYGTGKKEPEPVDWKSLDVYLPSSAYYYPDCPQARLPAYEPSNITVNEQL